MAWSAPFGGAMPTARITAIEAPAGFGKSVRLAHMSARLSAEGFGVHCGSGAGSGPLFDPSRTAQWTLIDDADRIPAELRAGLIERFLGLGSGMRLVLAGRSLDGFHLARHMLAAPVEHVDGRSFLWPAATLRARWSDRLHSSQIDALHQLTEGWAAPTALLGLHLAAGGTLDPDGVSIEQSMAGRFVREELLAGVPAAWMPVLAQLALLPGFDADLLDLMADDGRLAMSDLARQFGPLLLQGDAGVFRFNRLLAAVLAMWGRAQWGRTPPAISILSDWALRRGDVVPLARLAAAQPERLRDIVCAAGGLRLWLTHGYDDVRALVDLAEPHAQQDPRIALLRCVVLLKDGAPGAARQLYDAVQDRLPGDEAAQRDAALVRATLVVYGCVPLAQDHQADFERMRRFGTDPVWRTMLPTLLAIRHSQLGEFDRFDAQIADARAGARNAGVRYNLVFLHVHAAAAALAQGLIADAQREAEHARRLWRRHYPHDRGLETVIASVKGLLALERGHRPELRRQVLRSGHRLPGSEAWLDIYAAAFEALLRLQQQDGGAGSALAAAAGLQDRLRAAGLDRIARMVGGIAACIAGEAFLDNALRAEDVLRLQGTDAPAEPFASWQECEFATLARCHALHAAGRPGEALALLGPFAGDCRARSLHRSALRADLLCWAIERAMGRAGDRRMLARALSTAQLRGMTGVLQFAAGAKAYRALRADGAGFSADLQAFIESLPDLPEAKRTEPLTRRERQMLEQLQSGGSDKEIGRALGISEHAVHFHLKNLFRKLGIRSRREAVAAPFA